MDDYKLNMLIIICLTVICMISMVCFVFLEVGDHGAPTALWALPGACIGALATFLTKKTRDVRINNYTTRTSADPGAPGVPEPRPGQMPRRD